MNITESPSMQSIFYLIYVALFWWSSKEQLEKQAGQARAKRCLWQKFFHLQKCLNFDFFFFFYFSDIKKIYIVKEQNRKVRTCYETNII